MSKPWRLAQLVVAMTPLACSSPLTVREPPLNASEQADRARMLDQSLQMTSDSVARGGGNLMGGN
jgi:hypothetical protein